MDGGPPAATLGPGHLIGWGRGAKDEKAAVRGLLLSLRPFRGLRKTRAMGERANGQGLDPGGSPGVDHGPLRTPASEDFLRAFFSRCVCILGAMTVTVSLSTRVSPQVRDRLAAEASARGVPLATYTRTLLSAALLQDADQVEDAVQNEVRCIFAHLPMEAGLRREICLSLARTVEAGGTAGISAAKALLDEIRVTQHLFEPEWDEDEDESA
jgi:hypothetical protein